MRPVTGGMLLVAAVLTSPALAAAAAGTMPLDVALMRYLVVAGVCWAMLTLAAEWLWSEPTRPAAASETGAASDQPGAPADQAEGA